MISFYRYSFLTAILLFFSFFSFSQDSAFQTKGFYNNKSLEMFTTAAIQPDGKIIISGFFESFEGNFTTNIVRLNSNGIRDTTFDPTIGTNGIISMILVQDDGKIIFGGQFNFYKQKTLNTGLVRIYPNGDIDTTFTPFKPGYNYDGLITGCIQPDGKILLSGYGMNTKNKYSPGIIRLSSNGKLDTTFSFTDSTGAYQVVKMLRNGKIAIGGPTILRLNLDGTIDNSFQLPGKGIHHYNDATASTIIQSIIEYPDSRLLIGGYFSMYDTIPRTNVIRLLSNGKLDSSFNLDPILSVSGSIKSMAITEQNKILVGGNIYIRDTTGLYSSGILKKVFLIQQDGSLDKNANILGPDMNRTSAGVIDYFFPHPDGSFLGLGNFFGYFKDANLSNFSLFTPLLYPDLTFKNSFLKKGSIISAIEQQDGKIIVSGDFNQYDTNYSNLREQVARLHSDGKIDTSFRDTQIDGFVSGISLQEDGKVVSIGDFLSIGGIKKNRVARFMQNGALDTTFDVGSGPGASNNQPALYCSHIDSNKYIYIGGSFSVFNGYARRGITRIFMNGIIDTTFNGNSSQVFAPGDIMTDNSGNVLVAEASDKVNRDYNTPLRLYRLLKNGQPDTDFKTPSLGWSISNKVRVGADSTIYWLGELYKKPDTNHVKKTIVRLKKDGSLDSTTKTFLENYYITDFTILPDNNLLFAGVIMNLNADLRSIIMRLKPDLSIDSSFNPVYLYYLIKHITYGKDDRIIITGTPTRYLHDDTDLTQSIGILKKGTMGVYSNTTGQTTLISNIIDTLKIARTAKVGESIEQEFTMRNLSSSSSLSLLDTSRVLVSGTNAGEFKFVSSSTAKIIMQNDSLRFKLIFSPSDTGTKSINVIIPYSDGLDNSYVFVLKAKAENIVTAVREIAPEKKILIFPNPTNSGHINIQTDIKFQSYNFYDRCGQIIATGILNSFGTDLYQIPLGKQLSSGLYLLKLQNKKEEISFKIIVQK